MVERETEDRHGEKGYFGHPLAETTRKGRYALVLLGVCAVAFAGVTLTLIMAGRSLVWDTDGRLLYFPFMIAEGEWLRDIAASLLAGDLTVPLYSFDIGFGADWLITASGNSNEPINFLAALCPPEASEWLYDALVFLRFYLAALTFSFYCFSRGKGKGATLVGALCYVLCGYVLFWGVLRHPNFIDFAILLPLVFMGADKLFVGKNPLLLIASVAGIFMYSIYFAYMTCLFLLAYCLITYFVYPRERSVGDFALLAGKFALCLPCRLRIGRFFDDTDVHHSYLHGPRWHCARDRLLPDGGFLREFCQCAFGQPRGPERFGVGSDSGYCDFGSFCRTGLDG